MKKETKKDPDYALLPVESSARKGYISMFVIMVGFTFYTGTMLTGGTLGTSLNFKDLVVVLLLGNLLLGTYTSLLAYISSKTHLSTHLIARYSFGEIGSYLVSGILGLTQVGWFGVTVAMLALPLSKVFNINVWPIIIISGGLMIATAYFGVKSLTILSIIAVPLIAILGCYSTGISLNSVGGFSGLINLTDASTLTFATALSLVIGSFISGGTLTPDFTRFSKNSKVAVISTISAFFIGNILMFSFGAIGGMTTGLADISDVMIAQGLVFFGLLVLGLNIWTTNDNTIYAASLAFSNITKLPKKNLVIINGTIATLLSLVLYNNFTSFLSFLSGFIPSLGAVMISDYFFISKKEYEEDFSTKKFAKVNPIAIIAFLIGAVSSYLPGIASMNAVIASMLSYTVMMKIKERLLSKSTTTEIL